MHLDFRSTLIMSNLINVAMIAYLLPVWAHNRSHYQGIQLFIWGMVSIVAGHTLMSLQRIVPPLFATVLSNLLVSAGYFIIYISLRMFFGLRIRRIPLLFLGACLFSVIVEQFVFGIVVPKLEVRVIFMSLVNAFATGLSLHQLLTVRRETSLPGVLLILSFAATVLIYMIRIPITLAFPMTDSLMSAARIHAYVVLSVTLACTAWPIGFTLLIAHRLQQKERALRMEKELLMRELSHRTKNNIQVISGFLALQQKRSDSPTVKEAVGSAISRIDAIGLVHKRLDQSESLTNVSLKEYINELCQLIHRNRKSNDGNIRIATEIDDIHVLMDVAIPVGLIVNELVFNSFKHAFPDGKGNILVRITEKAGNLISMLVKDDGIGFPKGWDFTRAETLGLQIVMAIAEIQLSGSARFESDFGLACSIEFENSIYTKRI
jgi:two-component sensor histidine kinase